MDTPFSAAANTPSAALDALQGVIIQRLVRGYNISFDEPFDEPFGS